VDAVRAGSFDDQPPEPARRSRRRTVLVLAAVLFAVLALLSLLVSAATVDRPAARPPLVGSPSPSLSSVGSTGCPAAECPPTTVVVIVTVTVPADNHAQSTDSLATVWVPLGSLVTGLVSAAAAVISALAARRGAGPEAPVRPAPRTVRRRRRP
jgi:hypothetical protein